MKTEDFTSDSGTSNSPRRSGHPIRPPSSLLQDRSEGNVERREFRPRRILDELLRSGIIHPEDWENLPGEIRWHIARFSDSREVLRLLETHGLITAYQKGRVESGNTFGLVLGNYRILDRLGDGGMAIVFKAEHFDMRHEVAIKVLPLNASNDPYLQSRFTSEMRTIAHLRHPNIVAALDAGLAVGTSDDQRLWYLVMEHVRGMDLEEYVLAHGPLSPPRAVNIIHQIACALVETSKCRLVHRDIKPSNIMITGEDVAKLLDFGLSRNLDCRMTQAGVVLGTLDFMAPEQAEDASTVDIRADLYGLGGVLYWCLTGKLPFPGGQNAAEILKRRLTAPPPSLQGSQLSQLLGSQASELDAVIARLMATNPDDRFATPQAVINALLPFLKPESLSLPPLMAPSQCGNTASPSLGHLHRAHRVLVADDEESIRGFCRTLLELAGLEVTLAKNGDEALLLSASQPFDLILMDIEMGAGLTGTEVLARLREHPPAPNLKVVLMSGRVQPDEMVEYLHLGADDYFSKPVSVVQLQGRIRAALRLKDAQDRSVQLNNHLLSVNAELERTLTARKTDLLTIRNSLVVALSRLITHRDREVGRHPERMQNYCRILATAAALTPAFAQQIDEYFIETLVCCVPLHDIGKSGLPDHILLKPGKLTPDERLLMETHTTLGADTLQSVAEQFPEAAGFLRMAIDIVRHHHERFEGMGYPQRLAAEAIPLAARLVAIADVYDALRCRRIYKPALSHAAVVQLMTETSPGQFDPALLQVFLKSHAEFERVFRELPD